MGLLTYNDILTLTRADLNDQAGNVFTNEVLLPYLNMTLIDLKRIYELNNVPATNETSIRITVPAGCDKVGGNTLPRLPVDLVEIQRAYESGIDQDAWVPITKRAFLTNILFSSAPRVYFGYWAWKGQAFTVLPLINARDIKLDYVASIFNTPITTARLSEEQIIFNADAYIHYNVATLAAQFITSDSERTVLLAPKAERALSEDLGISTKGRQNILTRRMPFRAGFKRARGFVGN